MSLALKSQNVSISQINSFLEMCREIGEVLGQDREVACIIPSKFIIEIIMYQYNEKVRLRINIYDNNKKINDAVIEAEKILMSTYILNGNLPPKNNLLKEVTIKSIINKKNDICYSTIGVKIERRRVMIALKMLDNWIDVMVEEIPETDTEWLRNQNSG